MKDPYTMTANFKVLNTFFHLTCKLIFLCLLTDGNVFDFLFVFVSANSL